MGVHSVAPPGLVMFSRVFPRLTPWATFLRRSAPVKLDSIALIGSSLQRIHFVHVDGFVVPVDRYDERETHGRLGGRDGNGENHYHDAGEVVRVGTVTPERNKIQVGRIEH